MGDFDELVISATIQNKKSDNKFTAKLSHRFDIDAWLEEVAEQQGMVSVESDTIITIEHNLPIPNLESGTYPLSEFREKEYDLYLAQEICEDIMENHQLSLNEISELLMWYGYSPRELLQELEDSNFIRKPTTDVHVLGEEIFDILTIGDTIPDFVKRYIDYETIGKRALDHSCIISGAVFFHQDDLDLI